MTAWLTGLATRAWASLPQRSQAAIRGGMKISSETLYQISSMPEQAMKVALLFLAEQLKAHEAKSALHGARQKRYRDAHSDVTKTSLERHSDADVTLLARVEDKTLSSLTSGQEVKKERKTPPTVPPKNVPEGFFNFKAAYPKRDGSADWKAAEKAFSAALRRASLETILDGARRYSQFLVETDRFGSEFVKQARTWLNADGWAETYEVNHVRKTNGTSPKHNSIQGGLAKVRSVIAEAKRREDECGSAGSSDDFFELPRLRKISS